MLLIFTVLYTYITCVSNKLYETLSCHRYEESFILLITEKKMFAMHSQFENTRMYAVMHIEPRARDFFEQNRCSVNE